MSFDLAELLERRRGENFELHARYLNPQLAKVVKTLGFDRFYERGEGCYLYDADGKRYLDLLSGFGVFALGRSHPVIKDALHQAIDADLPNMVQMDCALLPGLLGEALVARSPKNIERVVFGNSGAEAVEASIKFARAATGRSRICYHEHAYHGLTMGALSLNGSSDFKSGFGPMLPGAVEIPFGDLDALRKELRAGDVAAFIVEPIQGKGVYELSAERWRELEAAVHESGALFICDEVQTGVGRTGKFYAFEHYGLTPDIITVSKALSGGYVPVGAMLASDKIVRSVYTSMDRAMVHSTTFKGNQLAMVAGLATLSVFDDEGIVEHSAAMGDLWKARLSELAERHEFLHDVRGEGQMIGIEFGRPTSRSARRRWRLVESARTAMFSQTLVVPLFHRYGILTQVAADNVNVIKLLPPLIAGETEVEHFVTALDELLSDAERSSRWLVEFGLTMAKGALKKEREGERVNVVSPKLKRGERVVVTGAAGFIGSAVTRALLRRGAEVVAILEPGASLANLEGLEVERHEVDITNPSQLSGVFDGARFCFHLAAKFGFWPQDPSSFYAVNVEGSRNVVRAATDAGVTRIVYTSTVATLGLWQTKAGRPSNEDDVADLSHLYGNYKRTKYVAEHEVLRLAAQGAPVVLVLPTMPHGPFDHRPTPSGKVVLDYLNGRMPGFVDTAMNVAHVDDLAEGHLLALEKGRQGRSYICGGDNITMARLLSLLSQVTGLPPAERHFPSVFPLIAGHLSQFVEGTILRREPRVPLEAAQMASTTMTFDDARARRELGYQSRPAAVALYDSAKWFVEHGYVDIDRIEKIHWSPPVA